MNVERLLQLTKPNTIKRHSLGKELIVSLTSYPKRFNILPIAIQSIMNQSVEPDRIILSLYEGDYKYLPQSIINFERLGLQILLIKEDLKSYKKILPALSNFPNSYIITCDDDIFYKPTLIQELIEFYERVGGIVAQRAHIIQFENNGELSPYSKWIEKTPSRDFYQVNSPLVFPTVGGGTLFPPNCFNESVIDYKKAKLLCPTADDVWLYFMAAHNGVNCSYIGQRGLIYLNQDTSDSLWSINSQGGNDRQIKNMIREFGMPRGLLREINRSCANIKLSNTVKLRDGRCLHVKDDHIGKIISRTEYYYEHDLIAFIARFVSPRKVIDIGTNIGNHAVGFAGHPDYHVCCFEPDRELTEIAKLNLEMNSISHEIFCHGLGAKNEELPFLKATTQNSGVGKFNKNGDSNTKVLVKRLDDCISEDFKVDLIKIDVEGFELDVLLGAINIIQKNTPLLIIEHQTYDEYIKCKEIISELGFRPIKVFCSTPTFIYIHDKKSNLSGISQPYWVDSWGEFTNISRK